ncbi:MAG TPA: hypothetical protein VHT71_14795 [Methylomirabilota bacterium]|nr:hypothetical protein [Methylomirabilota bacterium]
MIAREPILRAATWTLAAAALVVSLLIRSAGVTLVGALVIWLVLGWRGDRTAARRRLALFLPMIVAAVLVQAAWMHWVTTHEVIEWPIGGYPRSYVAQLGVKSGNHPELGAATLADVPARIAKNLTERTVGLIGLLAWPGWITPEWSSPLLLIPLTLIAIGLGVSLRAGGGTPVEWYFIGHETMYLLWPWDLEMRFLLPIAPLAGLYLWRGGARVVTWAGHEPRLAGAWSAALAMPLAARASLVTSQTGSRQLALATIFWGCVAVAGVAATAAPGLGALGVRWSWRRRAVPTLAAAGAIVFAAEAALGLVQQVRLGRDNLDFDLTQRPSYPDVEAGQWLRAHSAPSAIVMARQVDVVYHYAERDVVWFPPISDPATLMAGIRRYGVQLVVVNHRTWSYWRPPEDACFAALARAYPTSFRRVAAGPGFEIYEVVSSG